jgi:hypothetical protein
MAPNGTAVWQRLISPNPFLDLSEEHDADLAFVKAA